jgi:hypothetical protein
VRKVASLLAEALRQLDVACPLYVPYQSTRTVERFHALINFVMKTFQRVSPSGSGMCIIVRGDLFRGSSGFDPGLKFDDIELIRRLSKGRRFGIVERRVFVSDRRFREEGGLRMILIYSLLSVFFALGRFRCANRVEYKFGKHKD